MLSLSDETGKTENSDIYNRTFDLADWALDATQMLDSKTVGRWQGLRGVHTVRIVWGVPRTLELVTTWGMSERRKSD